jgi:DNA repair exonuclease SbcCD ATPase subunit
MKIAHVRISNILGIKELEFTPNGFTEISGPNGTGKTSVLEAIKSVAQAGHDATLLRKGETKGEVVLVLDDGTELHKTVTEGGSVHTVKRDGKKVSRPVEAIRQLTDALSVNPVEFLRAPKKDRVKVLLEAMPLTADAARLSKISGVPLKQIADSRLHALALIELVRQQVYDDRTGTNRAVKEKEATINQLTEAMPSAPAGVEGDEDELTAQVEAARATKDAELQRVDNKLAGLRTESAERIAKLKADGQAEIDAIRARVQAAVDADKEALATTEQRAGKQREKVTATFTDTVAPINAALAAIRADREAAGKRKATQEHIDEMQADLQELVQDAARQTQALDGIDAYKEELLAALPIPGVEVKDGEVFRNGVTFDRLNTAQQVDVAFQLAKLRAGELAVVCLDGLELMDREHYEALQAQVEASNFQVFVTRVQEAGEFSVKSA